MSELINTSDNRTAIRWKLLTGTSVLVLALYASSGQVAHAEATSRPQIWIELGGQFEGIQSQQEIFAPPFFNNSPPAVLAPMVQIQRPPLYSLGEAGKLTFQPEDSDWIFSASIRYGHANRGKHLHYQKKENRSHHATLFGNAEYQTVADAIFGDAQAKSQQSHMVADFRAGKDVGIGLLGGRGDSTVSIGVRFAQFTASSSGILHARPFYELNAYTMPGKYSNFQLPYRHTYTAVVHTQRDAHGVGPTLSWAASVPFAGSNSGMELTADWGVTAGLLFGRRRTRIHHQTNGYTVHYSGGVLNLKLNHSQYTNPPVDKTRSRSITIPNIDGFAGLSLKFSDAKVSIGYRADWFFNAMDGGFDTRKNENIGFYGPFASISIGFGG